MLVTDLINFGLKNKAPQVSFKFTIGDSMSVSSHKFYHMKYYDFMDILKARSNYRAHTFSLLGLMSSPHMITCSSSHSKDGDLLHLNGHFLLTPRADFTSHGLLFKATTSQLLGFTSHGSSHQAPLLSHHRTSVEKIHVLPKRKIPLDIIHLATVYVPDQVEYIPCNHKIK